MSEYTDLRTLPDDTTFRVINGGWTGTVFSKDGKKYIHIDETGMEREITGNEELSVKTFVRMKTITIRVPEKATNRDVMSLVFGIPDVIELNPEWLKYIDEYYAPEVLTWLDAPYKY